MNSLQQKIIQLEKNQTLEIKKALSELLNRSQASKIGEQEELSLTVKRSEQQGQETMDEISKSVSEASKSPKIDTLDLEQGNYILQSPNFTILSNITQQEKIEIIKTGFQRQSEGTISLRKYYESTDPNSLFQLKGYNIKYDSIRRIKLYQQFKPSNN